MSVPTLSKSILTDRNTVYGEQDIIELFISPEEVPLLNAGQGTYLKFLLNMDENATNCLAQPDPMSGGMAMIQTIQIYSGAGQLLEQLEDVNTWTAMYMHYSKTQGLSNMRTLMEGVSPVEGRSLKSQYFTHEPVSGTTFKPVECVVPLYMSGLLGQGRKLLPVVAFGGLRVRIQLAKSEVALRALTQVGYSSSGPVYNGIKQVNALPVAGASAAKTFCNATAVATATAITHIDVNTETTDAAPAAGTNTIQALQDFSNIAYQVGQTLYAEGDGNVVQPLGTITTITSVANRCRYSFATFTTTAAISAGAKIWADASLLKAKCKMSHVELVCSVVQAGGEQINSLMKQVASGGGIRLDYPSYNLYRQNLQSGIPRTELLVPCTEQRACSIVAEPMRSVSRLYEDTLRPVGDAMTSYIWNIANRLTPNRRVETDRVAGEDAFQNLKWNSIHLHETEKAIKRLNIPPRNLAENARLFCVGRELAKEGHSFDANTNEVRLNVEFGSSTTENILNKLTDIWLYHIRTAIITPNSVAVEF